MIWRLGSSKTNGELDLTWAEIADILNAEFRPDEPYQESAYRKKFQYANELWETVFAKQLGGDNYLEQLRDERQELYKVKTQVRDERNQLNRKLRDEARFETTLEAIEHAVERHGQESYMPIQVDRNDCFETDVLCCLSDIHYGIEFDSYTGKYDSDVAKHRLNQYASKVINIGKKHGAIDVYVSLLGDLISGIQYSIPIENRENLIDQIIGVSEAIADFIYSLTCYYCNVYVNAVGGNHSRIQPKDMAIKDERLDNLVLWHLQSKFSHMKNRVHVTPISGNIDTTVAKHIIRGKNYVAVHGDYDPFTEAGLAKLVMWLGYKPYAIIAGHMHTPSFKNVSSVYCIQSGSLSGSGDDYTTERRLRGDPSQTVCVVNESGIDAIYPVKLV